MNRILFVDDESSILQGLRDSLRKHRHEWDMMFVSSGTIALDEMAKAPFDVVVSDMRMPQMDGAELLMRIKSDYPGTARIVLSGQAEHASLMRALPAAHQFLAKPCPPERLREVILRTCNLRTLLEDQSVRNLVGGLERLPSAPQTYHQLSRLLSRPDVRLAEVIAVVEQDPAMSAKILQLVNSAYFGHGRRIASIRGAVTYLGTDLLKGLALSAHVFGAMEPPPAAAHRLDQIQAHSLRVANLVLKLYDDPARADEAFTSALVHDVGKLVLIVNYPERYAGVEAAVRERRIPSHLAELEEFGVTHAEVGAYLLGVWGLPPAVVEAVAYHHRPGQAPLPAAVDLLGALHLADALVLNPEADESDAGPDLEFLKGTRFGADVSHARNIALGMAEAEVG